MATLVKAATFGLLGLLLFAHESSAIECLTTPVREDNSWQNWYAENRCGSDITLHYSVKSGGKTSTGVVFAGACKRTRIYQGFLNDEVTFGQYSQPSDAGSCIRKRHSNRRHSLLSKSPLNLTTQLTI